MGVRFGVPGPHPTALTASPSRDMHHSYLPEHRHHDMMRPYLVLPRRLPHGAAYGHGADARIPGRPPNP
jgi:hypothetical protein